MQSDVITLATAFTLGVLHALEVDHMIAVSTFVSRRPLLRTAAEFGARWGLGHSVAVLIAGGILLVAGVRWPSRYDAIGEAVVGGMLIGLGAWAVWSARRLHVHSPDEHGGHLHLHLHTPHHAHHHPHDAGHPPHEPHGHRHGITLVGLMHGLSGTSAVVALIPVTLIHRLGLGFGYLIAFGLGVTLGMVLYAAIAALAMRYATEQSVRWGRWIASGIGLTGIAVGTWWVVEALGRMS